MLEFLVGAIIGWIIANVQFDNARVRAEWKK